MPATHISRTIHIAAAPEDVFAKILDFRQWPAWSPWIIVEPETKLTFPEGGNSYEWKGELIGAGRITKVASSVPDRLECKLEISKPWKSVSEVFFQCKAVEGGCEVTWIMNGKLPLVMFWMKGMMETLVGMDYMRGLTMLKELCETGSVPSAIEALGEEAFAGRSYVGVTTECKIPEIGIKMGADFAKIEPLVSQYEVDESNPPFSIYEKWNMRKSDVQYSVGVAVPEVPADLPDGFISGQIPEGKIFVIRHTGPYRHLGNAWALGMILSRTKKFQPRKGAYPFELYMNDPRKTEEKDLVVHICFPMV
ncbi:SRPBCC family protein [Kiritimatiellaeota bacterium B1221]|nr:SRPBCC family protein [Kiritimatiellaeota bacterium B1221]